MKMNPLLTAAELLKNAKNILVLTGAGMSTESGLKDFRSKDGLASTLYEGYYPEELLSRRFFYHNTSLFYQYLKEKLNVTGFSPNKGHLILAKWEDTFNINIITQNIDMLHQKAGSKNVLELHGTLATCTCINCHQKKPLREVFRDGYSCLCGGIYKPDIVLYDEEVSLIHQAFTMAKEANLLLVLGTSLKVYPAASIPEVFCLKNKAMIIINKDATPYEHHYNVTEIHDGIGATLERINKLI
ncbi:MAG TPA: NAD-dependent protein deacylase [Proteiniclasticum sp.]|nr:NAD-dependent protein deacylase [Proteiniclasticum sp.]